MSTREDRLDYLEAHRELEFLRSVGRRQKRRRPPNFQRAKIQERIVKLDDTQKAVKRRNKRRSQA